MNKSLNVSIDQKLDNSAFFCCCVCVTFNRHWRNFHTNNAAGQGTVVPSTSTVVKVVSIFKHFKHQVKKIRWPLNCEKNFKYDFKYLYNFE